MGLNRLFRQQHADDTEDDRRDGDHGADDAKHKTYDTNALPLFMCANSFPQEGGAVPPIGVVVISILYFSRACKKFLFFAQTGAFVLFVYNIR